MTRSVVVTNSCSLMAVCSDRTYKLFGFISDLLIDGGARVSSVRRLPPLFWSCC
jgi:hypothetical protein